VDVVTSEPIKKYMQQLQTMKEHDSSTIYVDFQDLVRFHETMAEAVEQVSTYPENFLKTL
jgi:hypothetical protein